MSCVVQLEGIFVKVLDEQGPRSVNNDQRRRYQQEKKNKFVHTAPSLETNRFLGRTFNFHDEKSYIARAVYVNTIVLVKFARARTYTQSRRVRKPSG